MGEGMEMSENILTGFRVINVGDGYETRDLYAKTEDGRLLRKGPKANEWLEVPKRGEYLIITENGPAGERW